MPSFIAKLTSQCFALLCNRAQCGHAEDDGGFVRRIARRPNPEKSGPHAFEFAHADGCLGLRSTSRMAQSAFFASLT